VLLLWFSAALLFTSLPAAVSAAAAFAVSAAVTREQQSTDDWQCVLGVCRHMLAVLVINLIKCHPLMLFRLIRRPSSATEPAVIREEADGELHLRSSAYLLYPLSLLLLLLRRSLLSLLLS
jgi:hypothetical protein